jgi:hypothetical protein
MVAAGYVSVLLERAGPAVGSAAPPRRDGDHRPGVIRFRAG